MLVLSRRLGEQLVIDDNIVIQVLSITGTRVQLGVHAPAERRIVRRELVPQAASVAAPSERPTGHGSVSPEPPRQAATPSLSISSTSVFPRHRKSNVPGHIVLAEDDDAMRDMLAQSLRAEGYEVTECRDGVQLVGCLWNSTDGQMRDDFDLVISDIRMPGVLGLSILAGVQADGSRLPMIMITAFGDEATHAEADRLGAAAILDKPFEVDDLLQTVRELLH